jgi:hypothetical protein
MQSPSSFEIDSLAVVFDPAPIRRHDWGMTEDKDGNMIGHPMERKRFRILADGEFVGWLTQPHGFGKQPYRITRVGKDTYLEYGAGYPEVFGFNESRDLWLWDFEAAAAKVAELRGRIRFGALVQLPTEKELKAHFRDCREEDRRDAEALEERMKAQEEERASEAERAAAERNEVLEGLESIDERLASQLTNHELSALRAAIGRFAPPPLTDDDEDY